LEDKSMSRLHKGFAVGKASCWIAAVASLLLSTGSVSVRGGEVPVTFAHFEQIQPADQTYAYTNLSDHATFNTITGGSHVFVTFDESLAHGLPGPLQMATLFLSTSTTQPATQSGSMLDERFGNPLNNLLRIVLDTPYQGMSNFLTLEFTGNLAGVQGAHSAGLAGSDAASDLVHFSSDFFDFSTSTDNSLALSFSSVNTATGGGLALGAGNFFESFTTSGSGTFSSNFHTGEEMVPEPSTLVLAALGIIGAVGVAYRRKR
jgi:hypothetical protein